MRAARVVATICDERGAGQSEDGWRECAATAALRNGTDDVSDYTALHRLQTASPASAYEEELILRCLQPCSACVENGVNNSSKPGQSFGG